MGLDSRLKKLEMALVTTRGDGMPLIRGILADQSLFVDLEGPADGWEILDPGAAGSARRQVFDLACNYSEKEVWKRAEAAGLTAELKTLIGPASP